MVSYDLGWFGSKRIKFFNCPNYCQNFLFWYGMILPCLAQCSTRICQYRRWLINSGLTKTVPRPSPLASVSNVRFLVLSKCARTEAVTIFCLEIWNVFSWSSAIRTAGLCGLVYEAGLQTSKNLLYICGDAQPLPQKNEFSSNYLVWGTRLSIVHCLGQGVFFRNSLRIPETWVLFIQPSHSNPGTQSCL